MVTWRYWLVSQGKTREDAKDVHQLGRPYDSDEYKDLAEALCDEYFSYWDYPTEIVLGIEHVPTGVVKILDVNIRPVPEFTARERK
jgi:hypothetical protein